jgi:hypothetical protein
MDFGFFRGFQECDGAFSRGKRGLRTRVVTDQRAGPSSSSVFGPGLFACHVRNRARFGRILFSSTSFFTGKRSFYLITLVENKAFLGFFGPGKLGKAFRSEKRGFLEIVFTGGLLGGW